MAENKTPPDNKNNKPGNGKPPQRPSLVKQIAVGVALAVAFNFAVFGTGDKKPKPKDIIYSELLTDVQSGKINEITLHTNNTVTGKLPDGTQFKTQIPTFDPGMMDTLRKSNVKITVEPPVSTGLLGYAGSLLPTFLILGFLYWMMVGRMGGGMGLGKSKAKMLTKTDNPVTFDDVAGVDEAKQDLKEIVDFLKDPAKFSELGGRIPKGALLAGPPGTGKTLLARAVAGEAGVPFFSISGSDFVEMFVGVGAGRVRSMFEEAKKNAPCILFIDEIDAVGRSRGNGIPGGGNDEREQTLNQLLVEMDGFDATSGIIILAATNRPDVLDPALLRPGRFDRQVVVPLPDVGGREKILLVHMQKIKTGPDVRASVVARGTPGFSGADLANLVNEAALMAGRKSRKLVTMADFEAARDKILMGPERALAMSDDERKLTAYHEAGHALISLTLPGLVDPLHKVTIIPRGRALGVTVSLPERDRVSLRKNEIEARLVMLFGGRVAEIMIFGPENVTTGASGDIQMATDLARRAVTEWGMSEKLGRVRYGGQQESFLGYASGGNKGMSEETAKLVDDEVRRMITEAEAKATKILTDRVADLHALAKGLLDHETLDREEVEKVIKGIPLMPPPASHIVPPVLPQPPGPPPAP